ncbi:putative receptor-like protein kinase HSL1 [Iris pallida]|uniref:non-specific serine/threonine protein kinase n=1 Tax=Iris pallida TaxID=29817 RepID=A0AAX6HT51_IRIPA|nr:putative receptor-like protein kinase HSL1 [Iris pallida]
MAPSSLLLLSFLPLLLALSQHAFLSQMKQSLSGPLMSSRWHLSATGNSTSDCGLPGLACDAAGRVVAIDVSSWSLAGSLPPGLCSAIPTLRSLRLGGNSLRGGFPGTVLNCSLLEELNLSFAGLSGAIPNLSPLRSLRVLDLSSNSFAGGFPTSIANLTGLEYINFNQNPGFDAWRLPRSIAGLTSLKVLILSTTSMRGGVPSWLGNMTSLVDLELSGNFLSGGVPSALGRLGNLQVLELYYNLLTGEIPEELGNLTELIDTDLSVNQLTGPIPEGLFRLPRLRVLQLYSNSLTGTISTALGNSTALTMLSVYRNLLSGPVPSTLGKFSPLVVLELSENRFTGELPPDVCAGGRLLYILVLGNQFTGRLPEAYADCTTLLRLRANDNWLSGAVPEGIFGLPRASIVDLGSNRFEGGIAGSIGDARNLSALFLQNNRLSGVLPPEISRATSLVKIDISNNLLSGPIPSEIGNLNRLNQLSLQGNRLDSSIPGSLSSLKSLNVLNLSNNLLNGRIPESLCELLPNSLDFSNNRLSGPVPLPLLKEGLIGSVAGNPALCAPDVHLNLTADPIDLPPCRQPYLKRRLDNVWVIGTSVVLAVLGALLFVRRWLRRNYDEAFDRRGGLSFSPPFEVTSFHKLGFEHHEIAEALIDKNIIGHGGSGTVYRVELASGDLVAVKRLWGGRKLKDRAAAAADGFRLDRELRAEVETLGSIRHKNIVKLYCCFSSAHSNLLVYEYMPNGNLWDALHGGWGFLDWPTRRRVAVGVARGLAYLHHDLFFPIVHRDVKTSNILLDADFEPKVADFGIAKVLQTGAGENGLSTTVVAGTCGYLAPEYAYSSKASTKCDVYSYGVVLMELITGKKPNEPEFGEDRDIIHWVNSKMASEGGASSVIDRRLSWSPFAAEMTQGLQVAVRCTCSVPSLRPTMSEVVQVLTKSDPCASLKLKGAQSFKLRESPPIRAKVLNMDLTM